MIALLLITLVSLFLFPPIVIQTSGIEFKLFISDFLIMLCGLVAAVKLVQRDGFKKFLESNWKVVSICLAFLMLNIVNGSSRDLRIPQIQQVILDAAAWGGDYFMRFQYGGVKEVFSSFRLVAWFLSLVWLAKLRVTVNELIWKTLSVLVLVTVVVLLAEAYSPTIEQQLGYFYHYSVDFDFWRGRYSAFFPSPLEAGTCIGFSIVLLFFTKHLSFWNSSILFGTTIALTRNATPLFAVFGVAFFYLFERSKLNFRAKIATFVIFLISILALAYYGYYNIPFVNVKVVNFIERFRNFRVVLDVMFLDWKYIVGGLGNGTWHTDNSYLLILTRFGLLGFAAFFCFIACILKEYWKLWSFWPRAVVVFLAVSGLTLDLWIYRYMIGVFLCVGLPYLVEQTFKEKDA